LTYGTHKNKRSQSHQLKLQFHFTENLTLLFRTVLVAENRRLCWLTDASGRAVLEIFNRTPAAGSAETEWERRQNYLRFPLKDGSCAVLEVRLLTLVPRPMASDSAPPHRDPFVREMQIGCPLRNSSDRPSLIVVRLSPCRFELLVEGECVDEEWPAGPMAANNPLTASAHPDVADLKLFSGWRNSQTLGEICRQSLSSWAETLPPMTPYWAPHGHNTWAADVMLAADDSKLHLFWLFDRRMGQSKFGCGAHQFGHATTRNLRDWEHHPLAFPITQTWQPTNGTGTMVKASNGYWLFSNVITERLGVQHQHPSRVYAARSEDGIQFSGLVDTGLPGEPGILRDSRGIYHAVTCFRDSQAIYRCGRFESPDLLDWKLADPNFLAGIGWPPNDQTFSSECFCWFRLGSWFYILGGRTGFWRSRALLGPYFKSLTLTREAPRWDVYDGLMVPQAAVFQGRAILGGWLALNSEDFGGHLVLRELIQQPDGELKMDWLRELLPEPTGSPVRAEIPFLVVDGRMGWQSQDVPCRAKNVQLSAEFRALGTDGVFGLQAGAGQESRSGVELRFEPARERVQWGTPSRGGVAESATEMAFTGGDFGIHGVEGLDRAFSLQLAMIFDPKSETTIIDAALSIGRTLITRRKRFTPGTLRFFAQDCRLEVRRLTISGSEKLRGR
jgi:hypothetical protein